MHRSVVAVCERRSGFLRQHLQVGGYIDASVGGGGMSVSPIKGSPAKAERKLSREETAVVQVELPASCQLVWEDVLDFMYGSTFKVVPLAQSLSQHMQP